MGRGLSRFLTVGTDIQFDLPHVELCVFTGMDHWAIPFHIRDLRLATVFDISRATGTGRQNIQAGPCRRSFRAIWEQRIGSSSIKWNGTRKLFNNARK
jgi:hypothetical protein